MKKYSNYKDSGVEWIGEIPKIWSKKKLGHIVNIQGRIGFKGYKKTDFVDEGEGCLVIGGKHIDAFNKINLTNPDYLHWDKYYESPEIMVKKGDLIISQRGTLGKVLFIDGDYGEMTINPSLVLVNKIQENPKFLWYYLQSYSILTQIDLFSSITTIPMLSQDVISDFQITLPPLPEQQAIVTYLDEKTGLIDDLIKKKQEKIQLLKENRTALINHVVTKGLDPEVEMKDSGVDGGNRCWIGEIPAHWDMQRLKYGAKINPQKGKSDYTNESDELAVFLPMEKVSEGGEVDYSIRRPISELWNGFTYFETNDVILAKITPCFENGKGALLDNLDTGVGFGSTEFHVIRASHSTLPKFLFYNTKSNRFMEIGESSMTGSAGQKRVPTDFVENFEIALPPISEQQQIVTYLDEQTQLIDQTIQQEEQKIELLKEYRQSLISEVVTGKICVV